MTPSSGSFSVAVAPAPSPLNPATPVPATVVIVPPWTLRILWFALSQM